MSEKQIKFTGWKAVVVVVAALGLFGARLMTLNDKKDDTALMREVEKLLIGNYLPDDAAKLKAVMETGDRDAVASVAKSITSTRLNVEAVQSSYPLFNFSTSKDVVIKVRYSLVDATGTREKGTKYYLFHHGFLGNIWRYRYETGVVRYYLNFL